VHAQAASESIELYALARAPMLSPLDNSQAFVDVYVRAITQEDLLRIINDCRDTSIEARCLSYKPRHWRSHAVRERTARQNDWFRSCQMAGWRS
jgi:hypothetical protein